VHHALGPKKTESRKSGKREATWVRTTERSDAMQTPKNFSDSLVSLAMELQVELNVALRIPQA